MRPRTATIQVWKEEDTWHVEIGKPGAASPQISVSGKFLSNILNNAITMWKNKEGLGD